MKTSFTCRTFLKTSSLGVGAILIVTMAGAAQEVGLIYSRELPQVEFAA